VGAALACPDRRVLCLTNCRWQRHLYAPSVVDYGSQRSQVTTVVLANRDYAVLKREFSYLGIGSPGTRALDILEIGGPDSRLGVLGQGHGSARHPCHFVGRVLESSAGRF
jgi:acetolactate synthase I/II/III large subunit